MKRGIIFIVWLAFAITWSASVFAQHADSSYSVGKRFSMQSSLLGETRKYWVRLPKDYQPTLSYPVIYVLDGELYFPIVSAEQDFLDGNRRFPNNKSIVVAIENTNRTRDLTPTAAISRKGQATMENSGKGEQFAQFIQKELIPQVEKQFSTSNRRILIGHSFGGLAATYFLLSHSDCFTDYLIMEPALWWDNGRLLNRAKASLTQNKYPANCHVYFAFAKQKDSSDQKSIDTLVAALHPQNILLKSQYFPNETHPTVYVHALYDGLRFIFDFVLFRRKEDPLMGEKGALHN